MKDKKVAILVITSFIFILSLSFMFMKNSKNFAYAQNADEQLKAQVVNFSGKQSDKILKVNVRTLNNKLLNRLSDGDYYYDVDSLGNINIISKISPGKLKQQSAIKISKDDAQKKGLEILKKLDKDMKNYSIDISEISMENNYGYSVTFKEKVSDDIYTGNLVYVNLSQDGTLLGAVKRTEPSVSPLSSPKYNKSDVKDIMFKYFSNHKVLSKYVDTLQSDNSYTIVQTVFNGKNIWKFEATFKTSPFKDIPLYYYIDPNSGEILQKFEPELAGF